MHRKLFRSGSLGIGSRRIVYERGCFKFDPDMFDEISVKHEHDKKTREEQGGRQEKNDLSYVDLGFALFIGIIIGMMAGSILAAL